MKHLCAILALWLLAAVPLQASRSFVRASSQYLRNASALATPPMTFVCWYRTSNLTDTQCLFSLGVSTDDALYLMFRGASGGDPFAAVANDAGVANAEATSAASGIVSGTWIHAGAIWASTTDRRVFVNGSKTTNATTVSASGFNLTNLGRFEANGASTYTDGQLAEAGLWNVALSDDELTALARGLSPLKVRPSALVEYWMLVGNTTNEIGAKGIQLTNGGSTKSQEHPRIYR